MGHAQPPNAPDPPNSEPPGAFPMSARRIRRARKNLRHPTDRTHNMTENGVPRPDRSYPVTPETREAILKCLEKNMGRNETARHLGIPGAYVSEVAKDAKHRFSGNPIVAEAMAARRERIDALRAEVELRMWEESARALEDMHAPVELVHYAPATENTSGGFKTRLLPEPQIGDRRNLAVISALLAQRGTDLGKAAGADTSTEDGRGVIDSLADGLDSLAGHLRRAGVNPTETPAEDTDPTQLLADLEASDRREDDQE